jgi:hypothetical protein
MDSKVFDKRTVKRNITNGLITKDDYDKFIASLPDGTSMSEPVHEKLYGDLETEEDSLNETDA